MNDVSPELKMQSLGGTTEIYRPQSERMVGRLRAYTPAECDVRPARRYVVKGLISEGDHVELVGLPGSGKSAVAPAIGYAVAQGRDRIFGRRVRGGPVLLIAAEDGHGMTLRVRALRARWGEAPAFYLVPEAVDLRSLDSKDLAEVERVVTELRPVLIIIDTLSRTFPGLAENEAPEMARVVQVVRGLCAICGSAVIMVHHVAKDAGTTPRGHGTLNGDADVTILVEGAGSDRRTMRLGKNRNGPSDTTFSFTISTMNLGIDDDEDPIIGPIAEETEANVSHAGLRAKEARLGDKAALLLREFRDVLAVVGEPTTPIPGMPVVHAVKRSLLRKRLIESGWFPDSLLHTAPDSSVALLRAGYRPENHALTTLKRNGFLTFNREWIWQP